MWIINILLLILVLGILILVHEFGHFIAARKCGVHVYEFAIGMGPIIWKKEGKDKTLYSLRAFPIGGFCQMAGEVGEDDKELSKDKFLCNKTGWQRFLILIAGVVCNFILAFFILFVSALIWGSSGIKPLVGHVEENYPIAKVGIVPGDKIVGINGYKIGTWDKAQIVLNLKHQGDYDFKILHEDGTTENYKVKPANNVFGFAVDEEDFYLQFGDQTPYVSGVVDLYPANVAGLENNDKILSINGKEVKSWFEVKEILNDKETEYTFKVMRDDKIKEIKIVPRDKVFGVAIDNTVERGIISSLKYAVLKIGSVMSSMALTVWNLIIGKLSLSALSGPVGIYQVIGQSAQAGIQNLLYVVAFLSINLGFINALPFPAFDGGRILFLIIEKIKGSPVKTSVENVFHTVGFILLMALMVYITFQDILRLF